MGRNGRGTFTDEERASILDEYLGGKSSGIIARKYNCSAGYVRSLAFYHVHGIKQHLVQEYKNKHAMREREF